MDGMDVVFFLGLMNEKWRNIMKILMTYLIVAILLISPVFLMADEISDAMLQAKIDAEIDANGSLWCILGGFFGIWPVIFGYIIDPAPNSSSLMNKSPQYMATYTETYKSQVKSIRGKQSLTGCIVNEAFVVGFCIIYYAICYIIVMMASHYLF